MELRVLGLGDNVADYYKHINRIYPGGCAYNFSAYAAMQEADSAYMGILGDDFAGRHLMHVAQKMGIHTERCRVFHGETPLPAVTIVEGERIFVGANEHGVWERPLILNPRDLDYISSFDLIHTSLYSSMEQNLEILSELGVPISMDFGTTYSEPFFAYICPHITYAVMSCAAISMEQMKMQMKRTIEYGANYVLATRGGEGAWFSDGKKIYHRPAQMVEAIDTMGAGDSFLTTFLLHFEEWRRRGKESSSAQERQEVIEQALDRAAAFSAKVCRMEGSFGYGVAYAPDVIVD